MSEDFKLAFDEIRKDLANYNLDTGIVHRYVAIPVPSLAIRYLLGYSGFPLSCFIQIVGQKASFKSMLSLEIAHWHIENEGAAVYIDTEGGSSKIAETFLHRNTLLLASSTMEDWMKMLTKAIKKILAIAQEQKKYYPVCFIVDSISGVTSKKIVEETEEEGFYSPNYPVEAKTLSTYFKQKASMLNKAPFTLIATNHIKEAINNSFSYGPTEYIPGGKLISYLTNIQLRVHKKSAPDFAAGSTESLVAQVEITTDHNRLANEGRGISVPIRFTFVDDENGGHYDVKFDWYAATTRLLTEAPAHRSKVYREKLLKNIEKYIKVVPRSAGSKGTYYYCEEWGLSKEDAMNESDFGKYIEEHPEMQRLYKPLMITAAEFYTPSSIYPPGRKEGETQ